MRTPHLDILKRQRDGSFLWIEAATDLRAAEQRMLQLATMEPGEYFVFDQDSQTIAARVAKQASSDSAGNGGSWERMLRSFGADRESKKEG
jgi:hypothetical protein